MAYFRVTPDRDQPNGWRIMTLLGVPVYIEPSFLIFMVIIFMLNADESGIDVPRTGLFILALFLSVLVHEFGHALLARCFRCDPVRVAFVALGGYTQHQPTTRGRSIAIIAAGPAFGFALAVVSLVFLLFLPGVLGVERSGPTAALFYLLQTMVFINFFWTLFNILPINPLDGGQILFHALTYRWDSTRAIVFVAKVSMLVALLAGLYSFRIGFTFLALMCLMLFMNNLQIVQALGRSS